MRINAIPAHIVDSATPLLGAQPHEAFIEVLDKLRVDERTTAGNGTTGVRTRNSASGDPAGVGSARQASGLRP